MKRQEVIEKIKKDTPTEGSISVLVDQKIFLTFPENREDVCIAEVSEKWENVVLVWRDSLRYSYSKFIFLFFEECGSLKQKTIKGHLFSSEPRVLQVSKLEVVEDILTIQVVYTEFGEKKQETLRTPMDNLGVWL